MVGCGNGRVHAAGEGGSCGCGNRRSAESYPRIFHKPRHGCGSLRIHDSSVNHGLHIKGGRIVGVCGNDDVNIISTDAHVIRRHGEVGADGSRSRHAAGACRSVKQNLDGRRRNVRPLEDFLQETGFGIGNVIADIGIHGFTGINRLYLPGFAPIKPLADCNDSTRADGCGDIRRRFGVDIDARQNLVLRRPKTTRHRLTPF